MPETFIFAPVAAVVFKVFILKTKFCVDPVFAFMFMSACFIVSLEKRFSGERTKVTLFYKTLYNIISHEGSNIFSKDTLKQADLNVKANSGSTQNFLVNLNTLNTVAATGANINISGKVEYHDTTVSTGAEINAEKLRTTETYATSTTGGVLNVSATKELEANSKLGGIINVHEKTDKITESISVGGVVNYLYDQ